MPQTKPCKECAFACERPALSAPLGRRRLGRLPPHDHQVRVGVAEFAVHQRSVYAEGIPANVVAKDLPELVCVATTLAGMPSA